MPQVYVRALIPEGSDVGAFGRIAAETADFRTSEAVWRKALEMHRSSHFSRVAAIYEFNIELAAKVREVLNVPGLRTGEARKIRNKLTMQRVFSARGIPFPKTCRYPHEPDGILPPLPWVLKPAEAGANLGVTLIRECENVAELHADAIQKVRGSDFQLTTPTDLASEWILTEFIDGPEFEANLVVSKGEIVFQCLMEKRTREIEGKLFEVRMVTPIRSREFESIIKRFISDLVAVVNQEVAQPSGDDQYILYPEFRIREGKVYCLEVAYRAGGTSEAVARSTGVDLDKVAAAIITGNELPIVENQLSKGVCLQILYSTRPGRLNQIKGAPESRSHFIPLLFPGGPSGEIRIPQSAYVAFLFTEADTPEDAEAEMEKRLESIQLVIDGSIIPMSEFTFPLGG
jgi:predicted ATP-grasp superfamily ATP-dependent carboligase